VPQLQKSFERLSLVLEQIPDSDVPDAISLVRDHRAGSRTCSPSQPLAGMLQDLEQDELMWLDMVLCVRAQQTGREAAWRRFAESAYRDFVPFYR
jgi:hypothetical protein